MCPCSRLVGSGERTTHLLHAGLHEIVPLFFFAVDAFHPILEKPDVRCDPGRHRSLTTNGDLHPPPFMNLQNPHVSSSSSSSSAFFVCGASWILSSRLIVCCESALGSFSLRSGEVGWVSFSGALASARIAGVRVQWDTVWVRPYLPWPVIR